MSFLRRFVVRVVAFVIAFFAKPDYNCSCASYDPDELVKDVAKSTPHGFPPKP